MTVPTPSDVYVLIHSNTERDTVRVVGVFDEEGYALAAGDTLAAQKGWRASDRLICRRKPLWQHEHMTSMYRRVENYDIAKMPAELIKRAEHYPGDGTTEEEIWSLPT